MWHGYFGIENLNLNGTQRALLVDALRALGPASDSQPCHLNHWRTRTDGEAVLFEALFSEENLTIQTFKNRLGGIFGVDPATIDHSVNPVTFHTLPSAVVTFSRSGTDYLRVVFFGYDGGGDWPTWKESRVECNQYLINNIAEW